MGLAMQGEVMRWDDLIAQDLSWNRMMYSLPPSLLGFALKAVVNMLPTPDNLARWRCGDLPCKLCGAGKPTPAHILSSCPVALSQGRYLYRHNQVLTVIYNAVLRKINDMKSQRAKRRSEPSVRFHRAGERPPRPRRSSPVAILDTATDWRIACDLPIAGDYVFPVSAATTTSRPDIVVWSPGTKQLVILELTVPNETRVVESMQLKQQRYKDLAEECRATFATTVITAEVGTRGFLAAKTQQAMQSLGVWSGKLHADLSSAALRGSYAIYINRSNTVWSWDTPVQRA
jgi:hypothetical protein